jgi:hypothetical protein
MEALGRHSNADTRVYFTGGATAVLYGWRESTIDVDIKIMPDRDELLRLVPGIKERLHLNVELASPMDFIPVNPQWEERSPFIKQVGRTFFHHFDMYAQALSKIERDHEQDRQDVQAMFQRSLVKADPLRAYFKEIVPFLYRYPSVDPRSFIDRLNEAIRAYQ